MKPTKRIVFVILLVLALPATRLLWAAAPVYPELDIFNMILGIIENPDPIGQCQYVKLTANPDDPDAHKAGGRDDGRPAFEFDRATATPLLTWAYDTGSDHDIAFNVRSGTGWDPKIEFITSSTADELDPRLYVDRYNRAFVIWWENDGAGRVMLAKRDFSGNWTLASLVGAGRRPSVAVWQDDLVIAYERDRGFTQEIVFARSQMGGPFVASVVAVTSRTGRLDPIVHVRDGVMWIDWKQTDTALAYSNYQGVGWKAPQNVAWTDPSWLGELVVRHAIEVELTR